MKELMKEKGLSPQTEKTGSVDRDKRVSKQKQKKDTPAMMS
jgi:hypothetical protein